MTETELAQLINQALQAGGEAMAKAAGLPQLQYQQITLGPKWRQTLKEKRAELTKQHARKLEAK